MARVSEETRVQRINNFRKSLADNKSEAEIMDDLGLSEFQLSTYMAKAARERWPELKTWEPVPDVIQAKTLPDFVQSQVRKASGVEDPDQCRLIRVTNCNGEVVLRCAGSKKDTGRGQASLPYRRTAGALPAARDDDDDDYED